MKFLWFMHDLFKVSFFLLILLIVLSLLTGGC
jgi:hypothetical protein